MERIILYLLVLCLIGCSGSTSEKTDQTTSTEQPAPSASNQNTQVQQEVETYPSIPVETMRMLWDKCDFIDYVFYELPISLSQNEKYSIQQAIRHVSDEIPRIKPDCPAIARLFYQVEGENVLEAEFFYGEGCLYYIFYKDGKKTYANKLTKDGMGFYQDIFAQLQQQNTNQGQ